MKKIAIIGAGAAGLMAAITAAKAGADVTVFEQNSEAGKKILASGNGKCNIINRTSDIHDFEGEAPAFAMHALEHMRYKKFESFCREIGLLLEEKNDGKCYPLSHEARAVQTALQRTALRDGVQFILNAFISKITFDKGQYTIRTAAQKNAFDSVIVATGSPAAPQLGGNASGMELARCFGHRVIDPFPSLVGLHLDEPALSQMAGVKTFARVTLSIENEPVADEEGDILFTKYGISGFAILDLSYRASYALSHYSRVTLSLDLLPALTRQSLATHIEQMAKSIAQESLYDLMCGLIPHKLVKPLLLRANIPINRSCGNVNAKMAKQIAYALKHWRFDVTDTHGYKHAEVAGGGVATDEIDAQTMESKRSAGLYFAGEVIDITGHRGGFNFHFAWASGFLAGKYAANFTIE